MNKKKGIIKIETFIAEGKIKISVTKLNVGGADILDIEIKNHHIELRGATLIIPLVNIRLRVLVVSYIILAIENIADELIPWAIISPIAPAHPHIETLIRPTIR